MIYQLKNSTEKIGRGGYPQSQEIILEPGKTVKDSNFIWQIDKSEFPSFSPNTGTLKLMNGSKVTDFISAATISWGFIISKKVKKILENFSLPPIRFYKCPIIHKGKIIENYFLMHLICDLTDKIDFRSSDFYIDDFGDFKEHVEIDDLNDFNTKIVELNKESNFLEIKASKLRFDKDYILDIDIFQIESISNKTFITKRINDRFIEEKVTGIDILESRKFE